MRIRTSWLVLSSPGALTAGLALLLASPPAAAADGVIEINQTRALAGGITPGDAPGFPVTLDGAASYVLTGALEVSDADTTGVEILADHVSLDLNGFEIACPGCAAAGAGDGVSASFGLSGIRIRGGTVRGFGDDGLALTALAVRVEHVRALANHGDGIVLGANGVVRRCVVSGNQGHGIVTIESGSVQESVVSGNGGGGIQLGIGSSAIRNVVVDNTGTALEASQGNVVQANTVASNTGTGILALNASVVNNVASFNTADGIESDDSTLVGNVATTNGGLGLKASSLSPYGNGLFRFNSGGAGPDVSGGVQTDANACGGDLTCP